MPSLRKLVVPLVNRVCLKLYVAGTVVGLACNGLQAGGDSEFVPGRSSQVSSATQQSFGALPTGSPPATHRVDWIVGPAKVELAGVAQIEIPPNFRFADARNARVVFEQLRNPVPKHLVGLLVAPSGEWFALIELSEPGHVSVEGVGQLNPDAILTSIREIAARQAKLQREAGAPVVESIDWVSKPVYDPGARRVEWAFKAVSRGNTVVNYVVRQLGRTHVLDFVAVAPHGPDLDLHMFGAAARNMTFLPGHRYEDFQTGDKVASSTLDQLLIAQEQDGTEPPPEPLTASGPQTAGRKTNLVWLIGCVLGMFLTGVAVVVFRAWAGPRRLGNGASDGKRATPNGADQTAAASSDIPSVATERSRASERYGGLVSDTQAGNGGNGKNAGRTRRKRQKRYMYDKFYSGMIMRLSGSEYSYGTEANETEVLYNQPIYLFSYNAVVEFERQVVNKASSLIETQTDLIEIQRQVIEEQRKLIDEQRKLLRGETQPVQS
ncbi:MAG: DUF2167 domain-containing protein [Verrucomicrobiae bacterium]|nr:DUF2167 domain-containing protein [Verrucomicrobiae bacterium]